MTEVLHVKEYRLFDRSKAAVEGKDFPLFDWEQEHLRGCEECQEVSAVFTRLCKEAPRLFGNGEMNAQSGWYKNVLWSRTLCYRRKTLSRLSPP